MGLLQYFKRNSDYKLNKNHKGWRVLLLILTVKVLNLEKPLLFICFNPNTIIEASTVIKA